jgi:hypothetical protein
MSDFEVEQKKSVVPQDQQLCMDAAAASSALATSLSPGARPKAVPGGFGAKKPAPRPSEEEGGAPNAKKVWNSISDMLIQNKCWVCCKPFTRGKLRKVFQVSQLLEFLFGIYKTRYVVDDIPVAISEIPAIIFGAEYINLNNCWMRLREAEFNEQRVGNELASLDIATWMSSLACCSTEDCESFHSQITGSPVSGSSTASGGVAAGVSAAAGGCLPGCGCDNPWQFIPATMEKDKRGQS